MINKNILLGRVGKDPEVRHLDNNRKVANFSLATSETYYDSDKNKQQYTEWHNIVIWGRLAEIVEKYVKKGDLLYLEGKNKTRSWEDKDGNKKYTTEVVCQVMQMLPSGKRSDDGDQKENDEIPVSSGDIDLNEPGDDLTF